MHEQPRGLGYRHEIRVEVEQGEGVVHAEVVTNRRRIPTAAVEKAVDKPVGFCAGPRQCLLPTR